MKKNVRAIMIGSIVGIGLIVAGIIVGIVYGFSLDTVRWNNTTLDANAAFTAKSDCTDLIIEAEAGEINIISAEAETVTVSYFNNKDITVAIAEKNGKLVVTQKLRRHFFSVSGGEITVKVPKSEKTYTVKTKLNAGNVTLNGITADLQIEVDAGTVNFSNCMAYNLHTEVAAGSIKGDKLSVEHADLSVNAGEIDMKLIGTETEYSLTGKTDLGECNFSNRTGTTEKYVNANVNLGSIKITFTE